MMKLMPHGKDRAQVAAIMPLVLKERLQKFALKKRWSVSQALVYFAEVGLHRYEQGVDDSIPDTDSH